MNSKQQIQFNGTSLEVDQQHTVSSLLEAQAVAGRFIVVINDEVVPKASWDSRAIAAGDAVEIMSPISGG
ncbi:sulfur carrier protein ThiS [uncultured Methylophaga sp.]|uniref:sulfur carrier protein ThiS n=1 Tax=uncultured Methylophaga sp. TaxID=285271 RepID=UPI00260661F2|nr:sulfur carrier protein ThiS [uncultured Methylophaga sp.]